MLVSVDEGRPKPPLSLLLSYISDASPEPTCRFICFSNAFGVFGLGQVQMKEQILRGLLRARSDGDGTQDTGGAAGLKAGARGADDRSDVDDTWKRREDLVKSGAVTPLDTLDDLAVGLAGRRRKTLQDYKIAEGMTVKIPRSRRTKTRPRTASSGLSECRHESGGERGRVDHDQGSLGRAAEVDTENRMECPLCAQPVKVDDPANPDVSISRHIDKCSRRSRRVSRHRLAEEDCAARSGDAASPEEGSAKGKGPSTGTLVAYTIGSAGTSAPFVSFISPMRVF